MASCDIKTYTNIKDLPQTFNITSGDYLVVENPQGTQIIDFKDIILPIEQTTFAGTLSTLALNAASLSASVNSNVAALSAALKTGLSSVSTVNLASVSPSVMNVRMSLSPDTATPTTNLTGVNASVLYVHPYKGDKVTLYNTSLSAWKEYTFNTKISQSLDSICVIPNINYDIYLSVSPTGVFSITSELLGDGNFGNVNLQNFRKYINGIAVNPKDYNKRLIGCIRSDEVPGRSVQTFGGRLPGGFHCKQYVWNAYNQVPVTCWGFDNSQYSAYVTESTGWRKVNPLIAANPATPSVQKHRFSFITGDHITTNLIGQIYMSYYANVDLCVGYTGVAIDSELDSPTLDSGNMLSELRGSDMTPRSQNYTTFQPGAHFIQLLENIFSYGKEIIMNESGHGNQTGYIVTLTM